MADRGPVYEVGSQFVEQLNYSNPLKQRIFPIWFRAQRYFALDIDKPIVLAENQAIDNYEFCFRYGTPDNPGYEVVDQFPVFNSHPGSPGYNPVRQIVWVFVPNTYQKNTLRSEEGIRKSPYSVEYSGQFRNHPIL